MAESKKTRWWWWLLISIFLLPILALIIGYQVYRQRPTEQPPAFDLYIAETFYERDSGSPFDIVAHEQRRPVDWQLDPRQFEHLDTVVLALKNASGEKFYYVSWGAPLTRLTENFIVYKNGATDTIPFGGYGCGTGVYVAPIKNGETMRRALYNPLMFHPLSGWPLPQQSDSFPYYLKEAYGDSVAIRFGQATYSTPWCEYKSQTVFSDYLVVSTRAILDNWKEGFDVDSSNVTTISNLAFFKAKNGQ